MTCRGCGSLIVKQINRTLWEKNNNKITGWSSRCGTVISAVLGCGLDLQPGTVGNPVQWVKDLVLLKLQHRSQTEAQI